MQNAQFTPGPYGVSKLATSGATFAIYAQNDERGRDLAHVLDPYGDEAATATAELFAKAPEMAQALAQIHPFLSRNRNGLVLDAFIPGTIGDEICAILSEIGLAPTAQPARPTDEAERLERHTMLALSTVHLRPETCNGGMRSAPVIAYEKRDYGWFCYVPEAEQVAEGLPDYPADLAACLTFASAHGFGWVMFDCDADTVDGLPIYAEEWATAPTPTGEAGEGHAFTVVWGNIGDDPGKRLDHVTVSSPDFNAIMDAAFACFFADLAEGGEELTEDEKAERRHNSPYDGFAILPGHVSDAPGLGFC